MRNETKQLFGVLAIGLVLSLVAGVFVVRGYSGSAQNVAEQGGVINVYNGSQSLGAASSDPTYLDSGEWTKWNDGYFDDLETEDDATVGDDLTVVGDSAFTGRLSWDGNVMQGSVTSLDAVTTTAYAVTAANVCNNTLLSLTMSGDIPTYTLPATSTLFADCLTTNGDYKEIALYNASSVTSTVVAAGTGGTLYYSSSSTIGVTDTATLRVLRDTATTYKVLLTNQPS